VLFIQKEEDIRLRILEQHCRLTVLTSLVSSEVAVLENSILTVSSSMLSGSSDLDLHWKGKRCRVVVIVDTPPTTTNGSLMKGMKVVIYT
jgi:hypothetical protein